MDINIFRAALTTDRGTIELLSRSVLPLYYQHTPILN